MAGHGAVDVDAELRLEPDLGEVHVHRAGDPPHLGGDVQGHLVGPIVVAGGAHDLDVDRSGEAEVEHLGGDVRREEEEGRVGVLLREDRAQPADVAGRRRVVFLQRDEDLRRRPGRSARPH